VQLKLRPKPTPVPLKAPPMPLHGANLIAIPDGDDLITAFSISDEKDKACTGCFSPFLAQGVKFNSCDLLVPYKNHRFMLINGLLRN
tara:strand:- start:246 stop:506 length:261 start_codon:yes stop_codon:yes gene_type:complete